MTDLCELQLERGALVLRGFDDLLAAHAELVPAIDAGRRRERDGAHAHLTLLSKHDTRTAAAALARENGDSASSADASAVLAFARRFVAGATIRGQSILPVGLGRASTSHFVVVLWPRGAALRARLGLAPTDFHVTIGFGAAGDDHGVAKGLSTLTLPLRQPLTTAATLVDAAERLLLGGMVSGAGGAASDDDGRVAPDVAGATAVAEAAAVVVADALEADADDTGDYAVVAARLALVRCELAGRARDFERVVELAREVLEGDGATPEATARALGFEGFALMKLGRDADAFERLSRAHALAVGGGDGGPADARRRRRERSAVSRALAVCCRRLGVAAPLPPIAKFPRTAHLFDAGGTAVTSDDLVLGDTARFLLELDASEARAVVIEEKLDGGNIGISRGIDQCINQMPRSTRLTGRFAHRPRRRAARAEPLALCFER